MPVEERNPGKPSNDSFTHDVVEIVQNFQSLLREALYVLESKLQSMVGLVAVGSPVRDHQGL